MDKIAQRRSMFQWLHEKANVPRKLTEWYSGEYRDQMELLRQADDNARQQAKTLEYWLRSEKSALNKRYYIDVVYFANQISNVVKDIIHGYDGLRELKKTHEHDIIRQREHAPDEFLSANAGIISRYFEGRAKRLLLGRQKQEMTKLYNKSKELIASVLRGLKEMGSLRSSGDIAAYLKEVDRLEKHLDSFNQIYSNVYNTYIKNLIPPAKTPIEPVADSIEVESPPESEPFPLTTPKIESPPASASPGIAPAIPSPPEPPPVSEPEKAPETKPEEGAAKVESEPAKVEEKPKRKSVKPRAKKPKAASDQIIIEMVKCGMEAGMSDSDIYSMLIEKSAEFDDEDAEFSMKLLAMAEGFVDE